MLGNIIKKLREDLNMSQETLAQKLNVSPSTIGMYETNKRQPNYETLLKISTIFNCSIDYLLGKSNAKNISQVDENKIIGGLSSKYEKLTPEQKELVKKTIEMLLKDK